MIILLISLFAAVGAAFGPIGFMASSVVGITFAHLVFDDSYEPQKFDDEDSSALFDSNFPNTHSDDFQINPATGLSMSYGGTGGFDVGGNPYGFDLSDDFGTDRSPFMNMESSNLHDFL